MTDGLRDDQRETIIPRHYCVAGYNKKEKKTRAVGGQRARLLGTFYIVTFLSLSHII